MSSIASLRRFVKPPVPVERCELCGVELAPDHDHLAEPAARRVVCSCTACAILFSEAEAGRYRRVPSRVEALADFRIADDLWAALGVPVGLAFFYRNSSAGGALAVYPSAAGTLESAVDADAWNALERANDSIRDLEPDIEAFLVNRTNGASAYFIVSLDRCYHLIGLIRLHWRGFTGGPALWAEVDRFFARLATGS